MKNEEKIETNFMEITTNFSTILFNKDNNNT